LLWNRRLETDVIVETEILITNKWTTQVDNSELLQIVNEE